MKRIYRPGQQRQLNVERRRIDGLELIRLDVHEDDRGFLYEVAHENDHFVPQIGQVYVVGDPGRGAIRAFHKHDELHDWFTIVAGSAKFAFVDDRPESKTHRAVDSFVISARKPSLIVVPPGVYHGWMSLEDQTLMLSVASHVYDRQKPDEIRVPPDAFNDLFGRNPWVVEAK
jgi:dTDP-4-dehydrorhamnose 3,5-epimerase